MKKIFFSLAVVVAAVTMQAQNPTVSTSYVDFQYCVDKTATKDTVVPDCKFPYTWNGVVFNKDAFTGGYALDKKSDAKTTTGLKTKRGCDSTLTMTVTYKDLTTYHNTVIADYCSKDLPYIWTVDGVDYEYNTSTTDTKESSQENEYGCKDVYTLDLTVVKCPPTGALNGVFTVNAQGKQIYFSKGNLQFCINPQSGPTTYVYEVYDRYGQDQNKTDVTAGCWRFAEHQWNYVGTYASSNNISSYDSSKDAEYGNVYEGNERSVNSGRGHSYTGWLDLFAMGSTGGNTSDGTLWPYCMGNVGSYPENIVGATDWGVRNGISNGGNEPGIWRTPTMDEFNYIINTRSGQGWNANNRWGGATIQYENNGVATTIGGIVILPDEWTLPEGITFVDASTNKLAAANSYTTTQWEEMEKNGAVFLPAAGTWSQSDLRYYGFNNSCRYWTSQRKDDYYKYMYYLYYSTTEGFHKNGLYQNSTSVGGASSNYYSVRLVSDVK